MKNTKNTMTKFELEDGSEVELTLAFYKLYQLKEKDKKTYDRYNKIMTKGPQEELEMITVLYAAYLCANIESEDTMTEIDFLKRVSQDRQYIANTVKELTSAKKK